MTVKETIEIIRESSLWQTLTWQEKAEVIAHVFETAGQEMFKGEDASRVSSFL